MDNDSTINPLTHLLVQEMDDEELLLLFEHLPAPKEPDQKVTTKEFNLDDYTETQCKEIFRFEKVHIPRLQKLLGIPYKFECRTRIKISGTEALCIFLSRMAYP